MPKQEGKVIDLFCEQERKRWTLAERKTWREWKAPLLLFYFGPTGQKRLGTWSNQEETSLKAALEGYGWPTCNEEWGLMALKVYQKQRTGIQCKTFAHIHLLREIPRRNISLQLRKELLSEADSEITKWARFDIPVADNDDSKTMPMIEIELGTVPYIRRKLKSLRTVERTDVTSSDDDCALGESDDDNHYIHLTRDQTLIDEEEILKPVLKRSKASAHPLIVVDDEDQQPTITDPTNSSEEQNAAAPRRRLVQPDEDEEAIINMELESAVTHYESVSPTTARTHHSRRRLIQPDDDDDDEQNLEPNSASIPWQENIHNPSSPRISSNSSISSSGEVTAQEIYDRVLKEVLEAKLNPALVILGSHGRAVKKYEIRFRDVETRVYELLKELRREFGADDPEADDKFLNGFKDEKKSKRLPGVSVSLERELRGLSEEDAKQRIDGLISAADKILVGLDNDKRRLKEYILRASRIRRSTSDALEEFDTESSDSDDLRVVEGDDESDFVDQDSESDVSEALEIRPKRRVRQSNQHRKRQNQSTNKSKRKERITSSSSRRQSQEGRASNHDKKLLRLDGELEDSYREHIDGTYHQEELIDERSSTSANHSVSDNHVSGSAPRSVRNTSREDGVRPRQVESNEAPLMFPSNDLCITEQNEYSADDNISLERSRDASSVSRFNRGLAAPRDFLAGSSRVNSHTSERTKSKSMSGLFTRKQTRRVVRGVDISQTALPIGNGFMVPNLHDNNIGHQPTPPPLLRPGLMPISQARSLFPTIDEAQRMIERSDQNKEADAVEENLLGMAELYFDLTKEDDEDNHDNVAPDESTKSSFVINDVTTQPAHLSSDLSMIRISLPRVSNLHPVVIINELTREKSMDKFRELDGSFFQCQASGIHQFFVLAFQPAMIWVKSLTNLTERLACLIRIMAWCIAADQPAAAFAVCYEAARKILKDKIHHTRAFSAPLANCEVLTIKAIGETARAFGANPWFPINVALESYKEPVAIGEKLWAAADEWQNASSHSLANSFGENNSAHGRIEDSQNSTSIFNTAFIKRKRLKQIPGPRPAVDLTFIANSVSTNRNIPLLEWLEISFASIMYFIQLVEAPNWGFVFDSCLGCMPWFRKECTEKDVDEWLVLLRHEGIDLIDYLKLMFTRIYKLSGTWEINKKQLASLSSAMLRSPYPFALMNLFQQIVKPSSSAQPMNERVSSRRAGEILNDCFPSWALLDVTAIPTLIEILVTAACIFNEKELPAQWPKIVKKAIGMIRNISTEVWEKNQSHFQSVLVGIRRLLEIAPISKPMGPTLPYLEGRSPVCLSLGDLLLTLFGQSVESVKLHGSARVCLELLQHTLIQDARGGIIDKVAEFKAATRLMQIVFGVNDDVQRRALRIVWILVLQIADTASEDVRHEHPDIFQAIVRENWTGIMRSSIPKCLKESLSDKDENITLLFQHSGRLLALVGADAFIDVVNGLHNLTNSHESSSPRFRMHAIFTEAGLSDKPELASRIGQEKLGDILWATWLTTSIEEVKTQYSMLLKACHIDVDGNDVEVGFYSLLNPRRAALVTKWIDRLPPDRLLVLDSVSQQSLLEKTRRNADLGPFPEMNDMLRWCSKRDMPRLSWTLLKCMVSSSSMGCDRNPERSKWAAHLISKCARLFAQGILHLDPRPSSREVFLIKHIMDRNPYELQSLQAEVWKAFVSALNND